MARPSNYTLLIICEGENTEPQFFRSIRDRIMEGRYPVEDMRITIRPEPKPDEQEGADEQPNKLKPVRKQRLLRPAKKAVEGAVEGRPPLKWVVEGQQELRDGTFNEVWVVFDNDNHPTKQEAFEKAEEVINDCQVKIGYSSIAFEYYLLLHFEAIYQEFEKSECREAKKPIHCSSGEHPDDCYGVRCVGGYARSQGYWEDSKTETSVFPLVENRIRTAFWNAVWCRRESDHRAADIKKYDRNPYVTTDDLVKRLTGYRNDVFTVLDVDQGTTFGDRLHIQFLPGRRLRLTNTNGIAIVIPEGSIRRLAATDEEIQRLGERKVIDPGQHVELCYASEEIEGSRFSFEYGAWHVLLLE